MKKSKIAIIAFLLAFIAGCSDDQALVPANTAPIISNQSFSIEEEAPVGTPVGTVVASDADPLSFSKTGRGLMRFCNDAISVLAIKTERAESLRKPYFSKIPI